MRSSLLRTDGEITEIYERHFLTVYRVCYAFMRNKPDSEDAVHETFCKLIKSGTPFDSEEHEKAWLIRTATNTCKNALRNSWSKRVSIDDHQNLSACDDYEIDDVFNAIIDLPEKYKSVVFLYYYEGYDSAEISKILNKPKATIRYHLHMARKILKEKLEGSI